jgi:crotonobetainyl-CoA:carnitine CoA-transferase CaiB-like acyl-CoA transferase
VKTTLFPITMEGQRLGVRLHPPRLGEHSRELLESAGFARQEIDDLLARSVVA